MLIGGLPRERLRIPALVIGTLAAMAMIIVGCTSVTSGTATIDQADAPVYRASVSASVSESQAAATRAAVRTSCDALTSSAVNTITAVNNYVDAFNKNTDDAAVKAPIAIDALNHSADVVTRSLSDTLAQSLRDGLNAWSDAAKALAEAIASNIGADDFNAAIGKLNDAKTAALHLCEAAIR